MSVLVKICAIFFLIIHCVVGQTTGSVHRKISETFIVGPPEETVTGSSTFSTENTETFTVSTLEGTDTTNTGSSTFSTENSEMYIDSFSEGTDITSTGSSTFSTENSEMYIDSFSEGTDITSTESSTFSAENSETYTDSSSEGTDITSTGSSTFITETSTVGSSEETGTTNTASSTLITETSTVDSSEETSTTSTGSSTFITETSTVDSSEETGTTNTGSSTFITETSTDDFSEETDTTNTDTTTPDFTTEYSTTPSSSTLAPCEEAENLNINIEPFNTSFVVSWNLTNSQCDFTYNITLNDRTNTTTNFSVQMDGLKPCTTYEVMVEVYYDDEQKGSGTKEESTLPATGENAKVQDLDIIPEPYALHVKWKEPYYNCDKYTYEISWDTGTAGLLDNNYYIDNLDPCTIYNVTVATLLDTRITTAHVSKLKSTDMTIPGPVEDLKIDKIDNNILHPNYINITWSEPAENKTCVDNYRYEVQHNGNTVIESLTKDTYIVIYKPDKCVNHTYIVFAEGSIGDSVQRNQTHDDVQVHKPPKHVDEEFKDNLVITKWKIGNNVCNPDKFYVSCNSLIEQSDIFEEGFKSQDMFIANFYNLRPDTEYNCCGIFVNIKGNSTCESATIQTKPKEPSSPSNLIVTVEKQNIFNIRWNEPSPWNGAQEQYEITVEYLESKYYVPDECTVHTDPFIQLNDFPNSSVQTNPLEYSAKYKISVRAKSSGGWGNATEETSTTLSGIPDPVRGLKCFLNFNRDYTYEANVTATWNSPCKFNGPLRYFEIELCKHRKDTSVNKTCENYNSNAANRLEYERVFKSLEAEYDYELIISVHNHKYKSNPEICSFTTPAGVPKKPIGENIFKMKSINTTTAEIYINHEMFSSDMGVIRYFAIIVAEKGCEEDPKDGLFDPKNWPIISSNCYFQDKVKVYQATPNYWNPFINIYKYFITKTQDKTFTLGEDVSCNNTNVLCNRPLTPNTDYIVKIRGFTEYGYSDTTFVSFTTESESTNDSGVAVGVIVGIIIGILAIAFLIAGALFYKNGRIHIKNWPRMDSESQISPTPPPVPIKKFDSHYRKMSENSGKIRSEFQLLSTISSDVTLSTKTASLPDNKKKNRYVNILPYDETRVILNVTNSSSSDYINASYIQGYSGNNEYIAAQGPTEATCPAFWQMILEQNVRVIVMLTQCVENGKDKCYKYFPTVVEEYDLNNDIKIECIEEQLFTVYNRRTFKVVKNKVAKKIIHLQFNLWPDFDVPDDVSKMIEFHETVKEINMKKPSLILIHCSAGVGRTGTLIAIDILTQNIRDKRKVDIFGTVLNLRKQRMTMVQSERQYEFLFKCVQYIILKNGNMSKERISESNM
ncbi:Protein tyrosine phosphatase 52F [Carabus blaptoides fortunei]